VESHSRKDVCSTVVMGIILCTLRVMAPYIVILLCRSMISFLPYKTYHAKGLRTFYINKS
jgi:hypothetical protein